MNVSLAQILITFTTATSQKERMIVAEQERSSAKFRLYYV